jgi:Ran GTPase-activating protein (RanGAP) involved in mRNA processing and transport
VQAGNYSEAFHEVTKLSNLRVLQVNCLKWNGSVDWKAGIKVWKSLEVVEFVAGNTLTDECVKALTKHCSNVHTMRFTSCWQLSDTSMQVIAEHVGKRLRRLEVTKCTGISVLGLLQVTILCRRLTCLSLQDMGWSTSPTYASIVTVLRRAPQLRSVDISGNEVVGILYRHLREVLPLVEHLSITFYAKHNIKAFVRLVRGM